LPFDFPAILADLFAVKVGRCRSKSVRGQHADFFGNPFIPAGKLSYGPKLLVSKNGKIFEVISRHNDR